MTNFVSYANLIVEREKYMKKYDTQKAQEKFKRKLEKLAYKLDKESEKEHELKVVLLSAKMIKLIGKRGREIKKYETGKDVLFHIDLTSTGYDVKFFVEEPLKTFCLEEDEVSVVNKPFQECKIGEICPKKEREPQRML